MKTVYPHSIASIFCTTTSWDEERLFLFKLKFNYHFIFLVI